MNINEIKTNYHVNCYFSDLIDEAIVVLGSKPESYLTKAKWRNDLMSFVFFKLSNDLYGSFKEFDDKKARDSIGPCWADKPGEYAKHFIRLGMFGKIKANNNLRDFGKTVHSNFYSTLSGQVSRLPVSASIEDMFVTVVYKELPEIARAGAKFLDGNNKAKFEVKPGNSISRGYANVSARVISENKIQFTVFGIGEPSKIVSYQLSTAFSKMDVVENSEIIKSSSNHTRRIEVTIRPDLIYKVKETGTIDNAVVLIPENVAVIDNSNLDTMLQNKLAELQEEKEILSKRQEQLAQLIAEQNEVDARIKQISRQMASLHTAWEVINEKPAGAVN